MLDGYSLALILIATGVVLLVGETLLPTHGVLGVGGVGCLLAAVFVCSRQNVWVGLALLVGMAAMTPLAWAAFVQIWPKTPVGRRLVLPDVPPAEAPAPVRIGQSGVAISELRPMGMCEFDGGVRLEAISEHGIVPPGATVRVVALTNNRPTVRVVT
jgi:membrane-bound ClpP family serine protease